MKTVSLELAKSLKEKGYPQDNPTFSYIAYGEEFVGDEKPQHSNGFRSDEFTWISAPTADEMLEVLPRSIKKQCWRIGPTLAQEDSYTIMYGIRTIDGTDYTHGETLADAAAKMWLYLKENDLLGVK